MIRHSIQRASGTRSTTGISLSNLARHSTTQKRTMWGTMRVETQITGETKLVMGVTATVVRDREWVDDELVEDTRDWYAQDKEGNVWYFGETVDNYEDGKLSDHGGSWEAGIDGARPGIIMPKEPKAGQTYRQEYYKGRAEDMGSIKATRKKVTVPQGTYDDCVQIRDWSRLESGGDYNYFCSWYWLSRAHRRVV